MPLAPPDECDERDELKSVDFKFSFVEQKIGKTF
jgi:hypothetical protein